MSASCELFVFHTMQRCHSVFSCFCPEGSFHDRLVAREKFATRLPPDVDRPSGSFPRFPIKMTLFKLRLTDSSWRECGTRRARYYSTHPGPAANPRAQNTFILRRKCHLASDFPCTPTALR